MFELSGRITMGGGAPETLVIVNRKASRGDFDLGPILGQLAVAGPEPELLPIDAASIEARMAAASRKVPPRVVIAGGDGTINSVLGTLLKNGGTLGVIPLGTANDFARTIGLPVDLMMPRGRS